MTQKTVPATVLKRLGTQCPEFALPVTIQRLDGAAVQIDLRCKALRKSEWAKVRDERQRALLESLAPATTGPAPTEAAPAPADAAAPAPAEPAATEPARPIDAALQALSTTGFGANVAKGLRSDAELVLTFALGWGLEDDFTADSLMALEDEFGGATRAIITAYETAIFHGRLGN
ncbi:phage tail assembly chaperone [Simplicispira sedimenti]|uniref:phage tail assembly chaperone n=1 Tax=Simplicispira sedimenti TaxID=2919500 RepID=UPI001FAAB1F0|nr:phage tail assembly chaperone [Acidovorax sp. W1-6]